MQGTTIASDPFRSPHQLKVAATGPTVKRGPGEAQSLVFDPTWMLSPVNREISDILLSEARHFRVEVGINAEYPIANDPSADVSLLKWGHGRMSCKKKRNNNSIQDF